MPLEREQLPPCLGVPEPDLGCDRAVHASDPGAVGAEGEGADFALARVFELAGGNIPDRKNGPSRFIDSLSGCGRRSNPPASARPG